METKKDDESLAKRMAIFLVCGLVAGLAFMFLREHLNASGQAETWTTINDLLFQDITAEGAEQAFGIFYIIGQLFIKALQLAIIPMVFTSISLAIGSISDTRTMGRIASKTLFWFLLGSFPGTAAGRRCGLRHLLHGPVQHPHRGAWQKPPVPPVPTPLNVVLNIIPPTSSHGLWQQWRMCFPASLPGSGHRPEHEHPGREPHRDPAPPAGRGQRCGGRVPELHRQQLCPFAVFVLLTRTFAIYGIDYLKPALVYVVVTVVLLLAFLIIAYPLVIALGAKLDPFTFIRKIANVAVFGFSTSSSAATLPLNIKVCEEEFGVDESIVFLRPAAGHDHQHGRHWWVMQLPASALPRARAC